jgi:hypothetical protein
MKKMRLNLVLSMTAVATMLTACQPKDVTVAKIGEATVNSNNSNSGANSAEVSKLLAVAIERQFEPIYLLKAILNPQYAAEQGLILNTDPTTGEQTLSTVNNLKVIDTPSYFSEYALKYDVQALVKDANGNLTLLVLKNKATEFIQTTGNVKTGKKDKNGKAVNINYGSKGKSEFISIKLTTTPGVYSVKVARAEETNSAADKQNSVVSAVEATFEWDGSVAALDNDVPMKLTALMVDRLGNKKAILKYDKITVENPVLVKIGTCVSATGSLALGVKIIEKGADKMTPPKYNNTVINLNDSSMTIGAFQSPAKDCANRPVIDLTRML